jgi:hypothetical protein
MDARPRSWDGRPLGSGPIAISTIATDGNDSPQALLAIAGSQVTAAAVRIPWRRLRTFLERHRGRLFVSENVATIRFELFKAVQQGRRGGPVESLVWALTREGRWVDLRLLDRQVRIARDGNDFRLRSWAEIEAALSAMEIQTDENMVGRDQNRGQVYQLRRMLAVFARLRLESAQLMADAGPPPRPVWEDAQLSPEEAERRGAQHQAALENAIERRRLANPGQIQAVAVGRQVETPSDAPSRIPVSSTPGLLGHHVEAWAAVSLGSTAPGGFVVDSARLPDLLRRAEQQYRQASEILFPMPEEVRNCFKWEDGIVARRNGYPELRDEQLRWWLRQAFDHLCDVQTQRADVPRDKNGRPTLNPEHWGFWAGCDKALWAWRQVYRMAEVARIAGPDLLVRPRYETAPLLRSREPNLAVYRALGVPVFRPREGHIFVVGKLLDLRTRCLAAVCVHRRYTPAGHARLYQYVLREKDPLAVAADLLYARALTPQERAVTDPERYHHWLRLTNALLETAPLGLPGSFLTRLLHNDYGVEELTEHEVLRLQAILAKEVAYELQAFLEDATVDLVAARQDIRANNVEKRFVNPRFPDTAGAALRKRLQRQRGRAFLTQPASPGEHPNVPSQNPSAPPPARAEIYRYRAVTLGGRVTNRAASAAVRRQEVLMAAEEVMLAVAHDLSAAGYKFLGLADNEFVLEVPVENATQPALTKIAEVAHEASRRILGNLAAPVRYEAVRVW